MGYEADLYCKLTWLLIMINSIRYDAMWCNVILRFFPIFVCLVVLVCLFVCLFVLLFLLLFFLFFQIRPFKVCLQPFLAEHWTLVNIPIQSTVTKRQCFGRFKWSIFLITSFVYLKCDPSHQNRAVVRRMHIKILLHLYGKKQRKWKEIKTYFWPWNCNAASNLHMSGIIFELIKCSFR